MRALSAVCIAIILTCLFALACTVQHIPIDSEYYPLALHNSWKYRVKTLFPKKSQSYVIWKVTHVERSINGPIYQLVPIPSAADDEFMQLIVLSEGIKEDSSKALIMQFPLRRESVWSTEDKQTFRIESLS